MSSSITTEFVSYLGIRDVGLHEGNYSLELDLEERHMSQADRAHGGVLFALLDTAIGRAVIAELPEGRGCATVEIKINYFRPIQRGRIRARGRAREKTRRLAYGEGEILDEDDRVLARASGTFFLTETMRQQDRERV